MTRENLGGHSRNRLSRRSLVRSAAALLSVPFVAKVTSAWAQEKLAGSGEVVVFTYGGAYTEGARRNVFDPFTKLTGIKVIDVTADVAEPQVMAMKQAGRIDWDIAFIQRQHYPRMHEEGMFVPIDYSLWDEESLKGVPQHARLDDAVTVQNFAYVLAYDQRAFPKGGPENWQDFWQVKKFPGPRGLGALLGKFTVPTALLADGVAHTDVWPLTDDKLDRAFKKLDEIKPYITKWWTAGGEPTQLLLNREYALTQASDGRLIGPIRQGQPIKMVWDGAYLSYSYGAILKGGPNSANAQKLLAFLNRAQIAAAWTQGIGFPGPNINQLKYLPADLTPLLNINPENSSKCVLEDSVWLAKKRPDGKMNGDYIQERWLAWRAAQ